jgi:hypothetical protein
MSNWAKDVEPFVRRQVAAALSVAADGASEGERGAAAKVVRALVGAFLHDRLDEVQATDIANVMGRRLDEAQVVGHLLRALVIGSPNPEDLTVGIERLTDRAAEGQLRECLWHLVCGMLESPIWRTCVREEWAREALAVATNPPPSFTVIPERLIRAWLDLHGSVPAWMTEVVEQRPDMLLSPHMPSRWVWPLHAAAPTTRGWHLLAQSPHHKCQPLEAVVFGPELDVALETLDRALGEEADNARRIALAGWLAEVGGQEP